MGGVDLTEYAKKESLVGLASTEYVDGRFTHLIGASAESLDTLEEIGKSLKNDADFAGTMTKELAKKADKGTVENALMGKATKEELDKKADKNTVYTKTESDANFQKKGSYVTKNEWTSAFATNFTVYKNPNTKQAYVNCPDAESIYFEKPIVGYLKKTNADEAYLSKVEISDYYTKSAADNRFMKKGEVPKIATWVFVKKWKNLIILGNCEIWIE